MKKDDAQNYKDYLINENINDLPSTLFVTDGKGNILISNEFTALTLGMSLEELLKFNVQDLVKAGYYNRSITMEAINSKKRVSQTVKTINGFNVLSTAIPILNKDDTVQLVVTTSNDYKEKLPYDHINQKLLIQVEQQKDDWPLGKEMDIVAESLAMKSIVQVCNQIASYDSKVLLYGESGTGKEVIAKYLHRKSDRGNGPMVSINCATIPPSLFEQELFGYEKGAYLNATEEKMGMFEMANGGTLFLDEISEMPLDMQAKLLRVLESNELRRVGGTKNISLNCRIITATNRDLWKMIKKGMFREDLYYRINVIPIHIPPLRTRKLDIVGLVSSFIAEFNKKYNKDFVLRAEEFQQILAHNWPGNARELKNYIERLVVTGQVGINKQTEENVLDGFTLDYFIESNQERLSLLKDFTAVVEGRYIEKVLSLCEGNATQAANKLGIHRSVIYRKLKKMEEVLETK
ncbi:sigma-54 interaction domain-containing protein [Bacillus massilinigeriensis]|uniref:sigma-54 interaction domain-containing protein n=1 Tax=Bacillus massilionigeriensis TaxID=1805475 RepID=UPI00096B1F6C|nr:sigma 54-interacting transcriptional regulator [Bacillus massilionigeriensis]